MSNSKASETPAAQPSSLSDRRRMSNSAAAPPALTQLSTATTGLSPKLNQDVVPREACAPSLNATAQVDTPDLTPIPSSIQTSATGARVGRSGTIKKSATKPSTGSGGGNNNNHKGSSRASTDAGYEGEVERHGQANDFVDAESDEDASAAPVPTGKGVYYPPRLPESTGIRSLTTLAQTGKKGGDPVQQSTQRNRNPSSSVHSHPARLPLQRNATSQHGGRPRASSISSTRSHEAIHHPFPTPGHKFASKEPFDDWKSIEETRLEEDEKKEKHWKRWGPYVSERQWVCGTAADVPSLLLIVYFLRPLFARTTLPMETRGLTSLTSTLARAHTAGARMVSPASVTTTARCASVSLSGTRRILS